MLSIRRATGQDVRVVHQWAAASFWEGLRPDQRAMLQPQRAIDHANKAIATLQTAGDWALVLIADVGGQPVGYAACTFNPDSSTREIQGFIIDLYVMPQWRRRGVGRALQQAVEQHFAGAGIRKIKVIGDLHNTTALQMAVRSGYRPEGLIGIKEWPLREAR